MGTFWTYFLDFFGLGWMASSMMAEGRQVVADRG